MSSIRPQLARLLLYGLAVGGAALLFARPDLLGRLVGGPEAQDPCRSPLAWHIRDVDPRFGFTRTQIRDAVEEGVRVWEEAADRQLFRRDTAGMAIDLVYDERQQESEERRVRAGDIAALEAEVQAMESLLADRRARAETTRRRYEEQRTPQSLAAYQDAITWHNMAVDEYNRTVERYNAAVEAERARGNQEVPAGNLRAEERLLGGRVVRVDRTLTVALAGGYEELVVVLSHELGHALGLGHVSDPDALMAAVYRQNQLSLPVELTAADQRALAEQCRSMERGGPAT